MCGFFWNSLYILPGQIALESFLQFPARQQYTAPATFAFQPDVGAQAGYGPFIRTTGVRFAQAQVIVQLQVW